MRYTNESKRTNNGSYLLYDEAREYDHSKFAQQISNLNNSATSSKQQSLGLLLNQIYDDEHNKLSSKNKVSLYNPIIYDNSKISDIFISDKSKNCNKSITLEDPNKLVKLIKSNATNIVNNISS